MTQLDDIFSRITLFTDERRYRLIHLPSNAIIVAAGVLAEIAAPFSALIVDKDEVTLILTDEGYADFARRLRDSRVSESAYRLITFDLPLDLGLTGFMARVSAALAAVNVPIMPLAAFERDHLLVPEAHFQAAWSALNQLREQPS